MIRALSISPRIIYCSDHYENGKLKSSLCTILKEHSSLEELDISPDFEEKYYEHIGKR